MRCLPDPATPRRGRWWRLRAAPLTAGAAALAAQLLPWVHVVLAVLVATSWTLVGLLVARAVARRYGLGLHLPAWVSVASMARFVIGLAGRLRAAQHPAPVSAEQNCYELVGGPGVSPVGER